MLSQFKPLGLEIWDKNKVSRRNLDDASKLRDSREESSYRKDDPISTAGVVAIIVGGFVAIVCSTIIILVIMKIVINLQNKKIVDENLKKYEEEFSLRTGNFVLDTEIMKFEQTECAICLCEF